MFTSLLAGKNESMILAISITELLTPTPTAPPKASGVNIWAIVVAASVLLTIIGSVIGSVAYINRYRQRSVERRINEIVQSQLDAESAEKSKKEVEEELQSLRGVRDDLSLQISRLPQEANKMFLVRQLEELASSINKDFNEYKTIEAKLQATETAATLDPKIREVIESAILPIQKQRERRNSYVLLILIALLVFNLSPIYVGSYVSRYFNILGDSPDWTWDSSAWMIVFGTLAVAFIFLGAAALSPLTQRYTAWLGRRVFVMAFVFLFIAAIILGYYWRENALSAACHPYPCGYPPLPYTGAGIAFNAAPILGGLLIFLIFNFRQRIFSAFTQRQNRLPVPDSRFSAHSRSLI